MMLKKMFIILLTIVIFAAPLAALGWRKGKGKGRQPGDGRSLRPVVEMQLPISY